MCLPFDKIGREKLNINNFEQVKMLHLIGSINNFKYLIIQFHRMWLLLYSQTEFLCLPNWDGGGFPEGQSDRDQLNLLSRKPYTESGWKFKLKVIRVLRN